MNRDNPTAEAVPPSPLERLALTNPDLELWLDASPLIFNGWIRENLAGEPDPAKRHVLEVQLSKLYDRLHPEKSLLQGATTNPPLCLKALQGDKDHWDDWVDNLALKCQGATTKDLFWKTYSEVVSKSAEMFFPMFKASNGKRGYVTGQVDPRNSNIAEMVKQAIALHQLKDNVMIKMPGTEEGIYGIMLLTSMGIPTNATLVFTVAQLVASAEAVKQGLVNARSKGVNLRGWRSVATMVLGRFEDSQEFERQAHELDIDLTEVDRRWAGVAVFKRAYKIFQERHYETKLLAASTRLGPTMNGKQHVWHLEQLAGGNIVVSVSPKVAGPFIKNYANKKIVPCIEEGVPSEILEKLLRIPYFRQAYYEDALKRSKFARYRPVVDMATSFQQATQQLEDYASRLNNEERG